jgi:hypothetical protein
VEPAPEGSQGLNYKVYTPKGLYRLLAKLPENHPEVTLVKAELARRKLPTDLRKRQQQLRDRDRDGYERD